MSQSKARTPILVSACLLGIACRYNGRSKHYPTVVEHLASMMISNDPSFDGASWQPFAQDVPWTLDAQLGEVATVYLLFRDEADNESVGPEAGMILYTYPLHLPIVLKAH